MGLEATLKCLLNCTPEPLPGQLGRPGGRLLGLRGPPRQPQQPRAGGEARPGHINLELFGGKFKVRVLERRQHVQRLQGGPQFLNPPC